jgi:hypothetical protein
MVRPVGITILSVLLAWLAVAGFGNAVVWNLPAVQHLLAQLPQAVQPPSLRGPAFSAVCLAYGTTAAVASIALWRMHHAAPKAYAAWCLIVLLSGLWLVFAGFEPQEVLGVGFAFGAAGFVALGFPYVAAKTKGARPNTSLERTRER